MRQVVEPGPDGDPDRPENPVERRADGVAADVRRRADEGKVAESPQGEVPVADLIAEHPEVPVDAVNAQRERQREDDDGERELGQPCGETMCR